MWKRNTRDRQQYSDNKNFEKCEKDIARKEKY